jgi:iron complex outermembrane receptor protein
MFVYMLNQAGDYAGYAYNFAELDKNHFAQAMVQGDFTTGPIRHEIVAGTSYQSYDSEFGMDHNYWSHDFDGNIYQDQPFRVTRDINFSTDGWPGKERQRALFLSDTLHLGDHVQAMLGARYTWYKMLDLDGDPTVESGYRTSTLTPTFALMYKPVPYVTIYGSYVEGVEAGSRVGGDFANVGDVLKATISKQYEVGAKYEHDGLSLTAAGFRIERVNTAERFVGEDRYRQLSRESGSEAGTGRGASRPQHPQCVGRGRGRGDDAGQCAGRRGEMAGRWQCRILCRRDQGAEPARQCPLFRQGAHGRL